jgi:hypothetical protein
LNIIFSSETSTNEYLYRNIKLKNGMNTLIDAQQIKGNGTGSFIPLLNHPISICTPNQNKSISADIVPFDGCVHFQKAFYNDFKPYFFNSRKNFYKQVTKSFCEEIQGNETPTSRKEQYSPPQYFVSLINCIDFSSYFTNNNNNILYFNGVGFTGRIKGLDQNYFIDGVLHKDDYSIDDENILYKSYFPSTLRAYKHFDEPSQGKVEEKRKFTGIYKNHYYNQGRRADSYTLIKTKDSDEFEINDYFYILENKLYKNNSLLNGINVSNYGKTNGYYVNGTYVPESKYQVIDDHYYTVQANSEGSKYYDLLYLDNVPFTGFNSSTLGNGKNSFYTRGYPTTKLCKKNQNGGLNCYDRGILSDNQIYKEFEGTRISEIFSWVEVRTIYSKYRKNLNSSDSSAELRPLLFKGNNPFIGKVDGKNYWIGYPN